MGIRGIGGGRSRPRPRCTAPSPIGMYQGDVFRVDPSSGIVPIDILLKDELEFTNGITHQKGSSHGENYDYKR